MAAALAASWLLGACASGEDASKGAPTVAEMASAPAPLPEAPPRCRASRPPAFQPAGAGRASTSSIALVRAGERLLALVADADEKALHVVDTSDMHEVGVTPLEGRPEHVLAVADGRVFVTLRDVGHVVALEPTDAAMATPFETRCTADAGSDPWAMALRDDHLLVTTGYDAGVVVLGERDLDFVALVHVPREPRGILVDGGRGFVTHAVGGVVSVVDLKTLSKPIVRVSLVTEPPRVEPDKTQLTAASEASPPSPPTPRRSTQGFALASVSGLREGGEQGILRLLAPQASSETGAPTAPPSLGYGGGFGTARTITGFVAVVDPVAPRMITSDVVAPMTVDAPDVCVLPRGAVADGDALFVACLDADVVLQLDARLADPMSIVRRSYAVAPGPTSVALDGKGNLFVHSAFARTLTRQPIAGGTPVETPLWRRAGATRDEAWLAGRMLFHTSRDARIGGGRACASCHPEGRDDGLVWSSPDGPRQTPMLAGRIQGTAPYGWFGENATLRDHLDHTFARLGGSGFKTGKTSAADIAALMHFVESLSLPDRSAPDGRARDRVARGKDVYVAYGCQGCHVDGKADGKTHEIGTGKPGERHAAFDTPSLLGVSRSAPYFHDGRYASLDELLSVKDSRMFSGTLSANDRAALIAYLETL